MKEGEAWQQLQKREQRGMEWFINHYAAYVGTIVYNILGNSVSRADQEEICSDVFFALWTNAAQVEQEKVKAYLGAVARNMARAYARKNNVVLPLEDDTIVISQQNLESDYERLELTAVIQEAVAGLEEPEREIFYRYYYYYEPIATIAQALQMNPSTVKTKLHRGRKRLKEQLRKRGYFYEDSNF